MNPPTSKQQQPAIVDENRHFRTDHLHGDLAGRSARGGAVILAAQGCKFVLSTAAAILLARLLAPEDYGLIGMVAIIVGFLGMFQYLGLSTATVRWAELNHSQVNALFWMNIGLSAAIMVLTLASAPLVAWFYHEPRLIGITAGYAVIVLLTGLSIQHEAILMRQMRFGVTAVIEIAAMAIGLCVATIAAWSGAGYWALVINQFVLALVSIVGVWTACKWRPGLPARGADVRSMLSYGGNLTGFNMMSYFSRNVDNALIGKFWGPYQLGIYSRAYQMLLMPMAQINGPLMSVAVPALSRLADSPARYRAAYIKILEKIAMVTMPGVVFMIATSDWLVVFLLGALWLFTTQGRARELFLWGIVSAVIAVLSIITGLPWGATGVAASYAATDLCITTPLLFWYAGRRGPVRSADFYRTIAPAVAASLCSLAALLVSRPWLEVWSHQIARLGVAFVMTIAVSLLVFAAIPAGRLAMRSFKETLMLFWKRERISVV
jgi:O-antigen/teichoic acid export membrane protein